MALFQSPELEYSPLPTPTSIRLLRIHRTRGGVLPSLCGYPLIRGSLHVVDLASDSAPAYEALSYTWDSPETENRKRQTDNWKDPYGPLCKWPVAIREGARGEQAIVYVRKNLFDALVHLQSMNDIDREVNVWQKTRLHDAAQNGSLETVRFLLEEGASCGARDRFGETPLHYAAANGRYEVVKILVASGADMNVYDNKGRLPVQCCVQRKRRNWEATARFLRDMDFRSQELRSVHGGDLELESRRPPLNKTPLIDASESGDLARVKNLIRRGANLSAQAKFGKTGLHHAAGNGHYDVVKALVGAGADLEILDAEGRTPLVCSAQIKRGQWQEISRFLEDQTFRQEELSRSAAIEEDAESELKDNTSGFLWIDAICINQADLEERSAQVRIMPQIYSKADCVNVWLGDDSQMRFQLQKHMWEEPDLEDVIHRVNKKAEKLKELEERWSKSLLSFLKNLEWDWEMPKHGILSINDIKLVLGCFLRSWFTRVWCIQELSLARKIRMFLGKTELDWHEVLKFLCLLAHVGLFRNASLWKMDKGWTMQDGKGGDGSEAWRLAEIRLRTANNSAEWKIVDRILDTKHCKVPHVRRADRLSLPLLIAATWSFESKDPRDKIYAILNLAAPLPPKDQIIIDYKSPVEKLYTQVAHIFFRGSGMDSVYLRDNGLAGILEPLEGLSYVQDPYYSGQQAKMEGLPTWVPDFSNPLTTDRIWRRSFGAAKALEPVFGCGDEPHHGQLRVLGFELDSVDMVEPGWANLDPDDMPPDLEVDVESWFKLLETLVPKDDEHPVQILFRTLSVDKLWKDCDEERRTHNAASFREFLGWELACHIRSTRKDVKKEAEGSDEDEDDQLSEHDSSETSSDDDSSSSDESLTDRVCDECDKALLPAVGEGWHCLDCEDFDYCSECYLTAETMHDGSHTFIAHEVTPRNEPGPVKGQVRSRLSRLWRAQSAGSTPSLTARHDVKKRLSAGLGRWFSHDVQVSNKNCKDSRLSSGSGGEDENASTPSKRENNTPTVAKTTVSGLKPTLLEIINCQRALEDAQSLTGRRFLPSDDEIPAQFSYFGIPVQKRLTSPTDWCKYHGDPSACEKLDDETSFRFHMVRVYRKRSLFRTKAGRLGLGPQGLKPGDAVYLLAGTRTPYLLRRQDGGQQPKNKFRFLGEAYVHGIMYGEAAAGMTNDDMETIYLE